MRFFSKSLTSGLLSIDAFQGISMISIQPSSSSSCNFLGGIAYDGQASTPITLSNNNSLTLNSSSPSSPLDGITITWLSGTINIIIGY